MVQGLGFRTYGLRFRVLGRYLMILFQKLGVISNFLQGYKNYTGL